MIDWIEESSFARGLYEEICQEHYQKGYQEGYQEGYQQGLRKGLVAIRRLVLLLQSYGASHAQMLEVEEIIREELEAADLDD